MNSELMSQSGDFNGCSAMNLLTLRFRMTRRNSELSDQSLIVFVLLAVTSLFSELALAQSDVITLESQVKGNQEQPNILSIVPWKQADDFSRIDENIDLRVDDVFQHLDRDEFNRQYDFYQHHLALEQENQAALESDSAD